MRKPNVIAMSIAHATGSLTSSIPINSMKTPPSTTGGICACCCWKAVAGSAGLDGPAAVVVVVVVGMGASVKLRPRNSLLAIRKKEYL